jgi:mono/diheme cytochrome c family protein
MTRALLAVLILLVLTACVGRPAQDASGEEIYLQLCANCHGDDLSGGLGPALGPGSNAAQQPDEFLVATITQGRGRMPSFATTLTDEQVDRLVSHLREAQGG